MKDFNEALLQSIHDDYKNYLETVKHMKGKKRTLLSWCKQEQIDIQAVEIRIKEKKIKAGEIIEEKTPTLYNLFSVSFIQDNSEPHILNIWAEDETNRKIQIGTFNFLNKMGYLKMLDGVIKEYKRWGPMKFNFWKMDNSFGDWNKNRNIRSINTVPYACEAAMLQYKKKTIA